jgi:predicted RNase H-like nuclease
MGEAESFIVAGVDGCKAGWLVAIVEVKGRSIESRETSVAKDFVDVVSATSDCEVICIDIPIGLSDGDRPRACDVEARRILGGRRASSVFPAPIRPILSYRQYTTANTISRRLGKGISRQSFALLEKIRQVDYVMTPEIQKRIREIHPEVCFWALNGQRPLREGKRSRAGQAKRHRLLERVLNGVNKCMQAADMRGYAVDDVYDAIVAAWTAGRVALDKAATLPAKPDTDSNGLRMEMVYPVEDF